MESRTVVACMIVSIAVLYIGITVQGNPVGNMIICSFKNVTLEESGIAVESRVSFSIHATYIYNI